MKISYNWLQKYFIDKLPEPEILAEGVIFHAFEIEEIEKVNDDTVYEIKILPDRAHDCLSHWGIAKEVSVIFDRPLAIPKVREQIFPETDIQNDLTGNLSIEVRSKDCRRYMGRIVKGVKIGPSPEWLSSALISIGQKSINNIVDATNYVMFDLGNPIHAFDIDKLASPKIIIEKAEDGEKITLLDGREVTLDPSVLTIRDEKDILVVAGVKGGKKAEIDNNTVNIMIEVANFDSVSVRKTAKKLGIFTDSAKRFENEIAPSLAPLSMAHVTDLILQIAGGQAYDVIDVYENNENQKLITLSVSYLNKMLGMEIPIRDIDRILNRFGYKFEYKNGEYLVVVSDLRLDLNEPHDLVEEIGRIYGYENVAPVLPVIDFKIKENKIWENINQVRNYLTSEGYREVMTYTFSNKGDVEVMASASDKNFLRTNLTEGVKKSYELNKLNAPIIGNKEIKIFEIGTVFPKGEEVINVCLASKKEIKEMSLEEYCKTDEYKNSLSNSFPEVLGRGSREEPDRQEKNSSTEISLNTFKPWSLYPFIVRDIAVWVNSESEQIKIDNKQKLIDIYKGSGAPLLSSEPILFDEFSKENRTSIAYRLIFQSPERTLTDDEVSLIMTKINEKILNLGFEVR